MKRYDFLFGGDVSEQKNGRLVYLKDVLKIIKRLKNKHYDKHSKWNNVFLEEVEKELKNEN